MIDERTILLLAKEHYRKVMMDTELLLKYIEVFQFSSFERAIQDVIESMMRIDERIKELEKDD